LGAEIALYHYLIRSGKNVKIFNPDPVPERYLFLDREKKIEIFNPTLSDGGLGEFDTAIIVDTADHRRVRGLWDVFQKKAKNILVFDHHPL
jgi:nanoRNase/pAp phosphatase (c-di-AMP/oligoRNAs hydrolase)